MAIIKLVADTIDFSKLRGVLAVSPYTIKSILDANYTPEWTASPFDASKKIASYIIKKTDGSSQTVFFNQPAKIAAKYVVVLGVAKTRKTGVFNGVEWTIEVGDLKPSLKPHGFKLK